MCGRCYQGHSKDMLKDQLEQEMENPQYSMWNSSSVHFLNLIIKDKTNCQEMQNLALKLLDNYNHWRMV